MQHFEQQKFLKYTTTQMFDLIMDIERYPEFLSWCDQAKIVSNNQELLIADLTIKFNIFMQKYRSHVTCIKQEDRYQISIESKQNIFEYLCCSWDLLPHTTGSNIKFIMDVRFKSPIFQSMITLLFKEISAKIISRFEARAKQIYCNLNN